MTPQEESDQNAEEQPSGSGGSQDTPQNARDESQESAGADSEGDEESGGATGNPANAG